MRCRRNLRRLIQEYGAAAPADRPSTELIRFRNAVVALKAAPSRLAPPHTQANRYDDYVYIHQQSMAGHSSTHPGPHPGHRGPMFFPWHREFLRQFENDLRAVTGDASICLPYWDWSHDQDPSDPGYPFVPEVLGGDGTGPGGEVETGVFAAAQGWTLTLDDNGSTALQRQLGGLASALPPPADVLAALAEPTYDSSPWNRAVPGTSSFRNMVEGWPAGYGATGGSFMHNRVHVWVGGSMLPGTSPNDPVFFLNHAKEDQLWAVWMQKHPGVAHYLPSDAEPIPAGHAHLKRLSDHMESLAEYFGAGSVDRPVDLLDHRAITWYDTDLPEVTVESGPALAFHDTPAGLTVSRPIRLRIRSGRPLFVSVTGAPTGNFSVAGGPDFPVTPTPGSPFETLDIPVRFLGAGADVQVSAVDLQVRIVDEEGYYAASPGDTFVVSTLHVELVAENILTNDSSVVLVLDRSGSMADIAAGGHSKSTLLKRAVAVAHELMHDTDEIGLVRFDHEADVLVPMRSASTGLGTALTDASLDPRGATSVGGGVLVGSALLTGPGATHPNRAMVVVTDGNENADPRLPSLPAGVVTNTTYAIGVGLPGQVSDATLGALSAMSGGYMLLTGNLSSDAERFDLAKVFLQILKDATRNQTVLDPPTRLMWDGPPQEIPFMVADSDVSVDIVALCPLPVALDFSLVTPGGQVMTPSVQASEPNVSYGEGADVSYYRLMLPALLGAAAESHQGRWTAVLSLRQPGDVLERIKKVAGDDKQRLRELLGLFRASMAEPVPANLSVYAYSNLVLNTTLVQDDVRPGAGIRLDATVREYAQPVSNDASVWADVVLPDGSRDQVTFEPNGAGRFEAKWVTSLVGLYRFVVHAEGTSSGGARYTRERTLTAGVWVGDPKPDERDVPRNDDGRPDRDFDLETVRRRFVPAADEATPDDPTVATGKVTDSDEDQETADFVAALEAERPLPFLHAGVTRPVDRAPRRPGTPDNLFVLPDEGDPTPDHHG